MQPTTLKPPALIMLRKIIGLLFSPVSQLTLVAGKSQSQYTRWFSKPHWLLLVLLLSAGSVWGQNSFNSGDFIGGAWNSGQAMSPSAGGSFIITKSVTSIGDKYFRFFGDGTPCGEYQPNTNGDYFTHNVVVTTPNGNCGSANAWRIYVPTTSSNVVFKTDGANDGIDRSIAFVVQGPVQGVSSISRDLTNVFPGQNVVVTANLSGPLSTGQSVYLRYTTTSYASSTVVQMTGSGSSYTATIPANTNNVNASVQYYCFTSGNDLSIAHADADFYTINLSAGNSYTVAAGWTTAAAGNWNSPATWTANAVPPTTQSMGAVNIGHAVTGNADAVFSALNINGTNTLTQNSGTTFTATGSLTVATNASYQMNGIFKNIGNGTTGISSTTTATNFIISGTGTYEHAATYSGQGNLGTIPTATWSSGSSCLISSLTNPNAGAWFSGGQDQAFSNFSWNCPSQSNPTNNGGGNLNIQGTFSMISTGSSELRITSGGSGIISCNNFSQTGGIINMTEGNTVGTLRCSGNWTRTGGIITRGGTANGLIILNGTTDQSIINTLDFTNNINVRLDNSGIGGGITIQPGSAITINQNSSFQRYRGAVLGAIGITYNQTSSILIYGGNSLTTSDNEWPSTNGPMNVTINTAVATNTISLHASRSIGGSTTGVLTLTQGVLQLNNNDLTIANNAVAAVSRTNGYVETNGTGQLIRTILTSNNNTYLFPVGNGSIYSPASYAFADNDVAGRQLGVRCVAVVHPNMVPNPTDYLGNRYWVTTLSSTGGTYNYTPTYTYQSGDITGTVGNVRLSRWNGSVWSNTINSTATATSITTGVTLSNLTGSLANAEWSGRASKSSIDYTWTASASGSWLNAANWTPNGIPTSDDIVRFTHGGNYTINNVPMGITLRNLLVSGTGSTTLTTNNTGSIALGGGSNPALNVSAGSSIIVSGDQTFSIVILTGGTGTVGGNVQLRGAGAADVTHTLRAVDVNGLRFTNGSYFRSGSSDNNRYVFNPFGDGGVSGTVIFENGSVFEHIAGNNPFALTQPLSKVVFQSGSLYRYSDNRGGFTPAFSGRAYANFEYNSTLSKNATGGSAFSIDNLTVTQGTFNINTTATPGHSIKGNISVVTGATLNFNPSSAGTILLNGTTAQTITNAGTLTIGGNATIAVTNTVGVNLSSNISNNGNMTVTGVFNCINENIVSGTGTTTVNSGGTLGIGSASGITTAGNALGNIQTSTRNFNTGGNYVYNGNLTQQTGNGLPSNITGTLTIANTGTVGNNLVTLTNNNTSTNALNLNGGLFAAGAGQTLRINAGGTVAGAGGHVSTNSNGEGGTIEFLGSGVVNGSTPPNLWNVTIANSNPSGVNFANNATIYNFFTINASGFVPASGAPRYANGSTLVYNTGGSYNRGGEFGNIAGEPGYPHHVMIQNGTTLNMGTAAPPALETGGNFTLGNSTSGGFANMGNLAIPLVVRGNLTIGNASGPVSALTLSTTSLGDLVVHGNFTRYLNSFYNDNSRAIFFRGSGNSTISTPNVTIPPASSANPTTQDYGYTIIDKDISTAKVILNAPVGITEKLTLIRGIITAISQGLFIKKPAPDGTNEGIAGGSADSYIDGKLFRYMSVTGTGRYSFPVGKSDVGGGVFKPVVFTTTNHPVPGSVFSAEYFGGTNATPLPGADENFLGTLQGVLRDEFWQFNKVSGDPNAAGKLAIRYDYNAGNIFRDSDGTTVAVCAACNVAVVKRDSDVNPGNWNFTKTDNNFDDVSTDYPEARYHTQSGFIQSGELTSFSPFTIGFNFNTILGTLPVKLLAFNGSMQQQKANLQWQIDSDKDVQHFELQHSTNGTAFTTVHTLLPAGNTYSSTHQVSMPGRHFYRLKVKEKNGRSFYSKVVVLVAGNSATFISGMQSTVVSQQAVVNLWSQQNQAAQTSLYDASGKLLAQQQQQVLRGDNQLKVAAQQLPQGIYFLQVQTADGVRQTLRWLKQ